jgi:hypothetical protein
MQRCFGDVFDRNVPRKPRLAGGVKGHNIKEITLPGSPAVGGSFTQGRQCLTIYGNTVNLKEV